MKKYSRGLGWIGLASLIAGVLSAWRSEFNQARVAESTGFFAIGTAFSILHIWAVKS